MKGADMTQRVFVTGATGVLGRRVVQQLLYAGHSVSAVARTEEKMAQLRKVGAAPIAVDLFDTKDLRAVFAGHDTVANLVTNIPTGLSSALPRAWRTNDHLRRKASKAIADAAIQAGVSRIIQESITFPYIDSGATWITEDVRRAYFSLNESVVSAESAASSIAANGGTAVILRFAMFMAPESDHMKMVVGAAQKGIFALVGNLDSYISFIHADDAAAAVVSALSIPSDIYNVAEADPATRSRHREALNNLSRRLELRIVPRFVVKLGGAATENVARSHRISTQHLQSVSTWRPRIRCLDTWPEVQINKGSI
jgi:2-alkyl-3-oxoalkanoate reductase